MTARGEAALARRTGKGRERRVLLVEGDAAVQRALAEALAARWQVRVARSVAEARPQLGAWRPDAVVMELALPDGDAFELLRAIASAAAAPALLVMSGAAAPSECFRLAQLGVAAFVPKPIEAAALEGALDEALQTPLDLTPFLRRAVGRRGVHAVEEQVRATMVAEALERSRGSLSGAARMLAISRQLLQHILKRAS